MSYTYPGGLVVLVAPPDGFVPNFENPTRQYVYELYIVSGVLSGITLLFMAQRLFTNLWIQRKVVVEDGLLLVGWLLIVTDTVLILRAVAEGTLGTHAYELEATIYLKFLVEFYRMPIIYPLCMMFSKMSLLVFYLRLSSVIPHKIACSFGLFFVFGSFSSLTMATAFPCKPLALSWNPTLDGACIDRPACYRATAILGLLTGFYIFVLLVSMVVALQMPWQQKAGLVTVFTIGAVTILTSILCLIVQQSSNTDLSWGTGPVAFWLVIEAHMMVICATSPSLRNFFRHVAPKFIGERGSGVSSDDSNTPIALVTFGRLQSKKKKHYNRFDDHALDTMDENGETVPYSLETSNSAGIEGGKEQQMSTKRVDGTEICDGDSQKGILTTRDTHVGYR